MPVVRIAVNVDFSPEIVNATMSKITDTVHEIKGDPKDMILVHIDTHSHISFADIPDRPAAMVDMINLIMAPELTKKLTESISDILLEQFSVEPNRMYIYFQEVTQMHLFAWNRMTFNDILGRDNIEKESEKKRAKA